MSIWETPAPGEDTPQAPPTKEQGVFSLHGNPPPALRLAGVQGASPGQALAADHRRGPTHAPRGRKKRRRA